MLQRPPRPPAFALESQKTGGRVHTGHQGSLLTLLRMHHVNAALLLALGYICKFQSKELIKGFLLAAGWDPWGEGHPLLRCQASLSVAATGKSAPRAPHSTLCMCFPSCLLDFC